MRKLLIFLTLLALPVWAQLPPATTPWTRSWLRSTDAASGRANLSIVSSNFSFNGSQLEAPVGNTLQIKSQATLTNPIVGDASVFGWAVPAFTNSAVLYVDPKGNDATAVRGLVSRPWKSPEFAATNAQSGDTILIAPGVYVVTNFFHWAANVHSVSVVGAGPRATVLQYGYTNVTPIPCIPKISGGYVGHLQITNTPASTNSGACIGFSPQTGTGVVVSNWLGEDLLLYGSSDTDYNRGTNSAANWTLRDCTLYGMWDIVTSFGSSGDTGKTEHNCTYENCTFYYLNGHPWPNGAGNQVVNSFGVYSTNVFRGCLFYEDGPAVSPAMFFSADLSNPNRSAWKFYDCTFTNAGAVNSVATVGLDKVEMRNCRINTALITNDGLDPPSNLTYGTTVASVFSLGGSDVQTFPTIKADSTGTKMVFDSEVTGLRTASTNTFTTTTNVAAWGSPIGGMYVTNNGVMYRVPLYAP